MDYRNRPVLIRSGIIAGIEMFFGACGILIWGLGAVLSLVKYDGLDFQTLLLALALVVPNALLVRAAVRRIRYSGRVSRLNTLFQSDADGVRLVSDLAQDLGTDSETVIRDMEWLLHNSYLKDCSLERGKVPTVYLKGGASGWVPEKKTVRCRNCGAFVEIRAGMAGKCEYCDSPVRDDQTYV